MHAAVPGPGAPQAMATPPAARLPAAFAALPVPLFLLDAETLRLLDANAAAEAEFGWPAAHLRAMHRADLWPDADGAAPSSAPLAMRDAAGGTRWVLSRRQQLEIDGRACLLEAVSDVTAQHAAAEAEAARAARLAGLMRAAGFGGLEIDLDAGEACGSAELFAMLGLAAPPDLRISLAALRACLPEDSSASIIAGTEQAARDGTKLRRLVPIMRADTAERRWLESFGETHLDAAGHRIWTGMQRDVTDRHVMETALAESEARLRLALEAARAGSMEIDLDTGEAVVSAEVFRMTGLAPTPGGRVELAATRALVLPEDLARGITQLGAAQPGDHVTRHFRIRRADTEEIRWIEQEGRVTRNPGGHRRLFAIQRDVTERRRMEDALAASERRLRLAVDSIGFGIWEGNPETGETYWSENLFHMFGYAPDPDGRASTAMWLQRIHPQDRARVLAERERARQAPGPFSHTYRIVLQDGTTRWIESHGQSLRRPDGGIRFMGLRRDITGRQQAAAALAASEQRLRLVMQAAGIGYVEVNLASGEVIAAAETFRMLGLPEPEGGRTTLDRLRARIHPEDLDWVMTQSGQGPLDVTLARRYRILRADTGEERWMEGLGRASLDEAGNRRWLGIHRDVTAPTRTQAALAESEERLRLALEAAEAGLFDTDLDAGTVVATPGLFAMLGMALPEGGRTTVAALRARIHPDDQPHTRRQLRDAGDGQLIHRRYRILRADTGAVRWIDGIGRIVVSPAGRRRWFGIQRDVTERVAMERALAASEERLRLATDGLGLATWDVDLESGGSTWSPSFFAMLGLPPRQDASGDTAAWMAAIHPGDRARVLAQRQAALNEGRPIDLAYRLRRADGGETWVQSLGRVVLTHDGRRRFVGIMQDISAVRAAQAALAESEERLRLAIEGAGFATWDLDLDAGVLVWSDSHFALFGYPAGPGGQASIAMWQDRVHPDDLAAVQAEWQRAEAGDGRFVVGYRIVLPDGTIRFVESHGRFRRDAEGRRRFVGVVVDVTARTQAERALAASEAQLRVVLDSVPECVRVVTADGTLVSINRAGLAMAGAASAESLLGRSILPLIAEHDRAAFAGALAGAASGAQNVLEYETVPLPHRALRLESLSVPLRLPDGQAAALSVTRDVTARRQAEAGLRAAQAEAMRASRVSAIGAMAAGLAHELSQPLAAVANYASAAALLLDQTRASDSSRRAERARAMLARLADQAVRAGSIVRRLREFVGRADSEPASLPAATLVEEALAAARDALPAAGVELAAEIAADAGEVFADRVQVGQVLANLIRNAIEAVAEAPRRRVVVSARRDAGAGVLFAIADTGPGLAPSVQARLFEPFVTSKPAGMGVGLAICRTIVEAHGGRIWAEPAEAGGTVFRFVLPDAEPITLAA